MNKKFLELYNYLKAEGMTDLGAEEFYNIYNSGDRFNELYSYLSSEGIMGISSNDFQNIYFKSEEQKGQDRWRAVTEEAAVPADMAYAKDDWRDAEQAAITGKPLTAEEEEYADKGWEYSRGQWSEKDLGIYRTDEGNVYQLKNDEWYNVGLTEDWVNDTSNVDQFNQIKSLKGTNITPVEDDKKIEELNIKFNKNAKPTTIFDSKTKLYDDLIGDKLDIPSVKLRKKRDPFEIYTGYDDATKGMKFRRDEVTNSWQQWVEGSSSWEPTSEEVAVELNRRHGGNSSSIPKEPEYLDEQATEEWIKNIMMDYDTDPQSIEEYDKLVKEAKGKPVVYDFGSKKFIIKDDSDKQSYSWLDRLPQSGLNKIDKIFGDIANEITRRDLDKKAGIKSWEREVKSIFNNYTFSRMEEEEAVPLLYKLFGKYGFQFEETDAGDGMIVTTKDGSQRQYIDLDTDDKSQDLILLDFIQQNADPTSVGFVSKDGSTYSAFIDKVESEVSRLRSAMYSSSETIPIKNEKGVVIGYKDSRDEAFKAYKEYENSDEYKQYIEAKKLARQYERTKLRSLYAEYQATGDSQRIQTHLDNKYLKEFRTDYNVELNNLSLIGKFLDNQYKEYNKLKEDLEANKANLTTEQLTMEIGKLERMKKNLDVNRDKYIQRYKGIGQDMKQLDYLTGKYLIDKEKQGDFFSGLYNSFLLGVSDVVSTVQFWEKNEAMRKAGWESKVLTKEEKERLRAEGLKTQEQQMNAIAQDKYKDFKNSVRESVVDAVGSQSVSEEYLQSENRGFLTKALFGVSQSLPGMLASAIPMIGNAVSITALTAQAYSSIEDEMLNDPDFRGESLNDIGLIAAPYAIGMGILEKIGLSTALSKNPAAKSLILKSISGAVNKVGGKGGREMLEKVLEKEIKSNMAKFGLRVSGGFLAEAETGATQSLVLDIGYKKLINEIKKHDKLSSELTGGEYFDTPDSFAEGFKRVIEDAVAEGIGGMTMTSVSTASQLLLNGNISLYDQEDLEFLKTTTTDTNLRKSVIMNLKSKMLSGEMTKAEAKSALDAIDEVSNIMKDMPDNLSIDQQVQAVNLVVEKKRLQKQIEGKDESLVAAQKQRISDIDNELKKISENAFQEQTTGEVPVQPEAAVGEEMEGGKPQAELEVVTEEGEEEVVDQYIKDLTETKESDPEEFWSVDSVTKEAATEGTVITDEDGGVVVGKDGDIKGLFKKATSKAKGVAQKLLKKAIEAGGIKLDNFDIYLTKVYERAGFRVVSRVPFNEEYAPEGWNEEKHGKPDVVAMVYDPNNELDIEEKSFTDYDEAIAYRDSFVEKTAPKVETKVEVSPTQNLVTKENADQVRAKQKTKEGQRVVTAAKMVLNSLPGVKVYVHETTAEYEDGIKQKSIEGDRGSFVPSKNEIHINLQNGGNVVTLFHEAMHSALQSKGMETGAILDMAKGLQSIISDKDLKARLSDFVSQYDAYEDAKKDFLAGKITEKQLLAADTEAERAEEYLAELGAIMSEAKQELTTTKFQRFKALLGRIFKKLGLPERMVPFANAMNAAEAVAFMNNLTKQLRTGEQVVSEGEIASPGSQILGTPEIKKSKQAKIENFDTTPPEIEGFEMIYPEKSTIDDVLEKSGGSAVFINSDGTKVGKVLVNGRELDIQGGIGYTFIKKNVDDNIGFAASEDQKISYLKTIASDLISERDSKNPQHKGKPIAVFVTSQNGETMLGEWYAAEYIMEGLDQAITKRKYKGGKTQAKKDFISAIESAKLSKTELGRADKKAKDRVLEMIKEGKFDTHNGRLEIAREMSSKNFSFGFRVNFNKELLSANEKTWNSGKNRGIKKALADVGHTTNDFWNKFMDERFLKVLNSTRLQADKGSSVSNKTFSGFFYNPSDSLEDQIKHARLGIDHAQFNSSFKSQGNFLLDSAYDVNKLFPNMGYPTQTGIDTYNEANKTDFSKKNTNIIDKINISTWLNENNKSDLVVNPYSSISLSIYTGITEQQQPEKLKKQKGERLAPNGKPSNLNEIQYEQVRTPEFKNWFGDWENDPENASKVVDENGEPLVVYHGSPVVDIEIFNRKESGRISSGLKELGIYFSTNKELAKLYSKQQQKEEYRKELDRQVYKLQALQENVRNYRDFKDIQDKIDLLRGKGRVYPVFLNLRDIHTFDGNAEVNIDAWRNLEVDAGYKIARNRDAMEFLSPIYNKENDIEKEFGIKPVDGIKAENIIEMSIGSLSIPEIYKKTEKYREAKDKYLGDAYLVFDGQPQNIKLADGTNKTFDPQQPSIKKQKGQTPRQQAIQKAKDKYELSVEKRGNSHNQGVSAALGDLQKSDWYENADDTAKDEAVREIKAFFGAKLKKAPSAKKITGAPKITKVTVDEAAALKDQIKKEAKAARDGAKSVSQAIKAITSYFNKIKNRGNLTRSDITKVLRIISNVKDQESLDKAADKIFDIVSKAKSDIIEVSQRAALKDQIRLEAKAAREAKKDLNEKRKGIAAVVKEMVKSGKITEKQAASIVAQSNIVNLDNTEAVQRFLDYVGRVFEDANYSEKLLEANKKKKSIRRAVKTNNQAEVIGMAKNFLNVDPSMAEDIDEYLEIAEKVYNAVRPSRVKDASVIYKEAANIGDINEYTHQQLKIQEDNYKKMLIAQYNDLKEAGLISESMDIKELVDTINMLKDPNESTDNTERVRKAVITRLNSMIGVLNNILQNKINPITGEDIDISEKDQKILKAVSDMELENLDIRSLIYLTEALENYFVNGITSGLEANVKSYVGVMKANLLFSSIKGTKGVYRVPATQIVSLPLLIERIFRSPSVAMRFMQDSGLMDIINGRNKAETTYNVLLNQYAKQDFYKQKDFMAEDNMYERGMLAFLMRNVSGNQEQMKAETQRRINAIKESIDNLSRSKNSNLKDKAKKYQEVADKLNLDSNDIDVIMANASNMNIDAVNWWINQWQQHYQDLYDISLSVYNTKLSSDVNYTPDNIKKTDTVSSEIDSESSFISSLGYVDTRKTGVLMENQRALPKDGYVDLSFEMNNAKSLRSALVDVNTAGAIRQTKAFLETKAYKDAMPDTETRKILNKRISNYITRAKGKEVGERFDYPKIKSYFNKFAKTGTVYALGGLLSAPKQLSPLLTTIFMNNGRLAFIGKKEWRWISQLGMPISNRGAEADTAVTMMDRRISKLAKGIGKVEDITSKFGDVWINVAIKYPDAYAARASFITYYKAYLRRKGINVNNIDWSTHEVNQEAANYAQIQVDRLQNVSDPLLTGEWWLNDRSRLLAQLFMAFTSFMYNQRVRTVNDLLTIFSKLSSSEEKWRAGMSLFTIPIELAVFQALGMMARHIIDEMKKLVTGEEDDDDEEKITFDTIFGEIDKETMKRYYTPMRSFIVDLLSPLPGITDELTVLGANTLFDRWPMISNESIDELVDEENRIRAASGIKKLEGKELEKFIQEQKDERKIHLYAPGPHDKDEAQNILPGSIGIPYRVGKDLFKISSAYISGEITKKGEFGETTTYVNEEDRTKLLYSIIGQIGYISKLLPREAGTLSQKLYNQVKKNTVSESVHEKQQELKKIIGRDLNKLELLLLEKSPNTKPENIKMESDYVNDELNEDQIKEYIKVRSKVRNFSSYMTTVVAFIKAGLTAEQVIDDLTKLRGRDN